MMNQTNNAEQCQNNSFSFLKLIIIESKQKIKKSSNRKLLKKRMKGLMSQNNRINICNKNSMNKIGNLE